MPWKNQLSQNFRPCEHVKNMSLGDVQNSDHKPNLPNVTMHQLSKQICIYEYLDRIDESKRKLKRKIRLRQKTITVVKETL